MRRPLIIASLGSLLCLTAAAQRPTPDEQHKALDTARELASHFSSKLPDFICNEEVERSQKTGNNVNVDHLVIQLSYADQKEKYKLVSLNSRPATQAMESLDGLITGGEFGSLLLGVFDPSSSANFQWKESTTIRKHPVTVYTYKIARANSHYIIGRRTGDGSMVSAPAGYRGEVSLDSKTSHVLRLTASADDIPKDSGILSSSVQVDYDYVDVVGHSYLLPSRSEAHMERNYRDVNNVVNFVQYRKFEADSTISFK
jgi:hypothetical protein